MKLLHVFYITKNSILLNFFFYLHFRTELTTLTFERGVFGVLLDTENESGVKTVLEKKNHQE